MFARDPLPGPTGAAVDAGRVWDRHVGSIPDRGLMSELVAVERATAVLQARSLLLTAELRDRAEGWAEGRALAVEPEPAEWAADEIAPALTLSPITARIKVERAVRIRTRLPDTLATMAAGDLDLGRVLAIEEATADLHPAHATAVEAMVLPDAVSQTAGELRAALRRAVIAVDPDAAERRRKTAVAQRRVLRYHDRDGTSRLEAVLSAFDTGEIYDLIDETARRTKTTDDTRTMDARRADAFVLLLLGREPHLGPEDPPMAPGEPPDDEPPDDEPPAPPPSDDEPSPPARDDPAPHQPTPGDEPSAPARDDPAPHQPTPDDEPSAPARDDPAPHQPTPDEPLVAQLSPAAPVAGSEPGSAALDVRDPEVDLGSARVTPTSPPTRDDRADSGSCRVAERLEHSGWLTDPDDHGPSEPLDLDDRFPPERDRIGELAALALAAMVQRRPARLPWVSINVGVAPGGRRVGIAEVEGTGPTTVEAGRELLERGFARPPPAPEQPPGGTDDHDPSPALADWIHVRDGTCRFPGCRRTARRCDVDHTIPYPDGPTVAGNLGALCRRHHRAKQSRWRVEQLDDGLMVWTSALGQSYISHPRGTGGHWRGTTNTATV